MSIIVADKNGTLQRFASEEFVGKTLDDARQKALDRLDELQMKDQLDVTAEISVLEEPQKKLFGLISSGEAKVNLKYLKPRSQQAVDYLQYILNEMKLNVVVSGEETDASNALISIQGEDIGAIIGRRGETLDALQYLASMVANRGEREYYRITVDSNGYREKRKATLEELAAKIAKGVLRSGRSTALEPMNPYERRIIHSVISSIDGVVSKSTGEEPYRKVIVSSTLPHPHPHPHPQPPVNANRSSNNARRPVAPAQNKNSKGRTNFSKNPASKTNNSHPVKHNKSPDYVANPPRSLDLSTSFEKEYQKNKPKPKLQDDFDSDLYDFIDLTGDFQSKK